MRVISPIIVYNKIDLLEREPRITRDSDGRPDTVSVSAKTGAGLDLLRDAIGERLAGQFFTGFVELSPTQESETAFELGAIQSEEWLDNGSSSVSLHLPDSDWTRLKQQHGF